MREKNLPRMGFDIEEPKKLTKVLPPLLTRLGNGPTCMVDHAVSTQGSTPLVGKGQRNSTVRVRTVCQERQMDWEPRCWAVTLLSGLEAPMEVFICLLSGSSNPRSDLLPGPELPDDALCTMNTNLTTKNIHHSTVYGSYIQGS